MKCFYFLQKNVPLKGVTDHEERSKFSVYQRGSQAEQGILTRRLVPPNNSCLFTAIDYVMNDAHGVNLESAKPMRRIVSKLVSSNRVKFNEGFLGRTNSSYCAWILDDKNWGGAIEVSILAEHYSIEIDVVDAQSGRINRFF